MKDHILTKEQAVRIGLEHLTGKMVQVELYRPGDGAYLPGKDIAKDVYYKGERIAGTLDLKE